MGNLKDFDGPQFLHIITKKGAGLDDAEADRIGVYAIERLNLLPKRVKKLPRLNIKTYSVIG
ncbi:MAG: hypothetical protein CM15mP104_2750 [Gammaproteobacteria bacterium]|nr:MAG: hypothetical protein CM15mP104_2750 [Gammaproteobacteria bacterium]